MKRTGISGTALSKALGVPYSTLMKQLNGESRIPATTYIGVHQTCSVALSPSISGSSRVNSQALTRALHSVFGELLPAVKQSDDSFFLEEPSKGRSVTERRGDAAQITALLMAYYADFRLEAAMEGNDNKEPPDRTDSWVFEEGPQ